MHVHDTTEILIYLREVWLSCVKLVVKFARVDSSIKLEYAMKDLVGF